MSYDAAKPATSAATWAAFCADQRENQRAIYEQDVGVGLRRVFVNKTVSTTIANTAAETAFDKSISLPAGIIAAAGCIVEILAGGWYSSTGIPTLTFRPRIGGSQIGTVGFVTSNAASYSWFVRHVVPFRTVGASGGFPGHSNLSGTVGSFNPLNLASISAPVIDTTGALTVDLTAQWEAASASNQVAQDFLYVAVYQPQVLTT